MKVTDKCAVQGDQMVYISDFTPLKSADADDSLKHARGLDVDFICVAYNPGKAVRVASAMLAYSIKQHSERDVIFNVSTRDMNKLALQSYLLGTQMLGLDNVVVVKGDNFTDRDLEKVKGVSDFKPTELIQSMATMNMGQDYKGLKLKMPTDLCIGATIDLGRGIEPEARLTYRKVQAGAHFFLTQPVFSTEEVTTFLDAYQAVAGTKLVQPVFFGLQIFRQDGLIFSNVPQEIKQDLAKGREGTDISLEILAQLQAFGIRRIYLVPPILKGGARDYEAAQKVLEAVRF
jgi:5,10-methylenetetrahydrofolate reductase